MYWTDDNANRIYQANLDGSNSRVILSTDLSCPGYVNHHNYYYAYNYCS